MGLAGSDSCVPGKSRALPLCHEGMGYAFRGRNRSQAQLVCTEKGLVKGTAGSRDPKEPETRCKLLAEFCKS